MDTETTASRLRSEHSADGSLLIWDPESSEAWLWTDDPVPLVDADDARA